MKNFVWAVVVFAVIEVIAIAITVDTVVKVNAGAGTWSIRSVLLAAVVVAMPPLIAVGLRSRFRADRTGKEALARLTPLLPDHVVFAAQSTPEFVAAINRVRSVSGTPPIASNRMPLVVSISKVMMSIDTTGKTTHRGAALTLMTRMIEAVAVEPFAQAMPGTRGSVTIQVLHLTIASGQLDLFIPVQTDGLGQTTREELEAIAARVAEKVRLGRVTPAS